MRASLQSPQTSLTIDRNLLEELGHDVGDHKAFITTKHHPTLPLSIHNYSKTAFMRSAAWLSSNPQKLDLCLAARTLVTERHTGNVISRSFSKFFNYHEKLAYKPTGNEHTWVVEEKVDGSIISFFHYQGSWQTISRGAFDSSHALQAKQVMERRNPSVFQKLDKEKTYVFELIDPKAPIKVRYVEEGLILLSIISKDGSEPPHDFDWSILPFKRPYIYRTSSLELKALSKLNRPNEEGFVIKFWRSPDDRHPQRIKVKFDSYLKLLQLKADTSTPRALASTTARLPKSAIPTGDHSKAFSALPSSPSPPSPASLVSLYKAHRRKIPSFDNSRVSNSLALFQTAYLSSLEDIADDYGGDAWLDLICSKWDRMHILLSLQEDDWKTLMDALTTQRFRPSGKNQTLSPTSKERKAFDQRMKRGDVDVGLRTVATAWWYAQPINKVLDLLVETWEVPKDMTSDEVIVLGE